MINQQTPSTGADTPTFWSAVQLVWEMGYMIALPAVVFGFGGAFADRWFQTAPALTLVGFALAMLLSFLGVRRRIKDILSHSN